LSGLEEAEALRTRIAAISIFVFFTSTLLCLYEIGGTGGALKGGYLMMSAYYTSAFGDRPASFLFFDKSKLPGYAATLLVQDTRSMRFFKARLGADRIQSYGEKSWIVRNVPQKTLFGYVQGMEAGIILTGIVSILSIVVPYYYDTRP